MSGESKASGAAKPAARTVEVVRRRCDCGYCASARSSASADLAVDGHVAYAIDQAIGGSHWRRDG